MRVRDGVFTFDLEWPKCTKYVSEQEPLSVHIIETDEATILFGAGDETTADELIPIAGDHAVDKLVVEHGDPDHYEGVPYLRDALDVEVAVPAGDADLLRDAGIDPDHLLRAEESYYGVQPIETPGHTPDNMAFHYENVVVAGDTVLGRDSVYSVPFDWNGPLAVITPDWNIDDRLMKESIVNLIDYEFEIVLVSHGSNAYENGKEAVATLVSDLGLE